MTVETYNPAQAVTVTAAAQEHFRKQLQGRDEAALRLGIKESGCTGYKYVLDLVENGREGDISLLLQNGITLYVDPEALPVLRGTEIDFTREGLNQTITFNNPNVADQCGCGESFSVG